MTEQSVFATLPAGRRTWAVGAIRGNAATLAALHRHLGALIAPADHLVYLGNYLGPAGDSIATIDALLLFRRALLAERLDDDSGAIVYLRGSEEEVWHKLLQVQLAPQPAAVFAWMKQHGMGAIVAAYGGSLDEGRRLAGGGSVALSRWTNGLRAAQRRFDGHERLMAVLKRAARTADDTLLLVSAGLDPHRPLADQGDRLWWGGGRFDAASEAYAPYRVVVRGTDPAGGGVAFGSHFVTLDGGSGRGGTLVAACFAADGTVLDAVEFE